MLLGTKEKIVTLTQMKLAPASLAMAFATSVLPQPGGPYKSTPVAMSIPIACRKNQVMEVERNNFSIIETVTYINPRRLWIEDIMFICFSGALCNRWESPSNLVSFLSLYRVSGHLNDPNANIMIVLHQ